MYLSFAKFGMLNSRNSISCLSCKVDVKLVSHQQGRKQMNWLQSMTKQQSLFSIILVLQNLYQLWPVSKKHRLQLVGRIKSTVRVSYPSLCFIFSPQCLVCVLYPNPCFIPSLRMQSAVHVLHWPCKLTETMSVPLVHVCEMKCFYYQKRPNILFMNMTLNRLGFGGTFSLSKQWTGWHIGTWHAAKLQLSVHTKSRTHLVETCLQGFKCY